MPKDEQDHKKKKDEQPTTDRKSDQLNEEELEKIAVGASRCGKCGVFYEGSHSCG